MQFGIHRYFLKQTPVLLKDYRCSICLDSNTSKKVALRVCSHVFDLSCIKPWLEKSLSCPLCRRTVEVDRNCLEERLCAELKKIASAAGGGLIMAISKGACVLGSQTVIAKVDVLSKLLGVSLLVAGVAGVISGGGMVVSCVVTRWESKALSVTKGAGWAAGVAVFFGSIFSQILERRWTSLGRS